MKVMRVGGKKREDEERNVELGVGEEGGGVQVVSHLSIHIQYHNCFDSPDSRLTRPE